VSKEVNM